MPYHYKRHHQNIYIFGPDLAGIKGNKVRLNPIRVDTEECVTTPTYLYKLIFFVMLISDVIFGNINALIITSEIKLKFVNVKSIPSWTSDQISKI